MIRLSIIAIAITLAGCSTTDYDKYATTQQSIAASKAQADTARYNALADIAKNGSDTARVAAVMALAMGGQAPQQSQALAAPQRSDALMWASVLVPAVTQAYSIAKSADVAINASNNAYMTSASTTAGFVGIASQIQAPVIAAPVLHRCPNHRKHLLSPCQQWSGPPRSDHDPTFHHRHRNRPGRL